MNITEITVIEFIKPAAVVAIVGYLFFKWLNLREFVKYGMQKGYVTYVVDPDRPSRTKLAFYKDVKCNSTDELCGGVFPQKQNTKQ